MKRLCVGALVLMVVGCGSSGTTPVAMAPKDTAASDSAWLAEAVAAAQLRQSVIAGHTLYSHDFVPGSSALNDQGRRSLTILVDHYQVFPGQVNIERGDAPKGLYARRIDTVLRGLARAGIETRRMTVADAAPLGNEAARDRMVLVQLRYQQKPGSAVLSSGLAVANTDSQP